MAYKRVIAIAVGTVATSIGLFHFNPDRDDEDGRYQTRILPEADAKKAESRELVKIEGDATKEDFDRQQAGFSARPADVAAQRIAELPDDETVFLAGGTATATMAGRNFPEGQGGLNDSEGDPDAAPVGGDASEPGPLDQSITKLTEYLKGVDDAAELDRLREAEVNGKSRDGALAAIDARKQELTEAA